MPFSVPVLVILTFCKYTKTFVKFSSKHQTCPYVHPLCTTNKVVVGVLITCINMIRH